MTKLASPDATETVRRPSFSSVVAQNLKDMIERDKMQPGARIPTEAELCTKYGVSRTVVREAIISLRSEGVLVARQGIGVFVGEGPSSRFEVDWNAIRTLPKTIMLFELRMAVEVESAGLCAERRTKADAVLIRKLMEKVNSQHDDPKSTKVFYDYKFHLAIAKASKNPHIFQFLSFMAPVVSPRVKLGALVDDASKEAYYQMIHAEHDRIVVAIEKSDAEAARAHMRSHIAASIKRLRALAASLPETEAKLAYEDGPELIKGLVRRLAEDAR